MMYNKELKGMSMNLETDDAEWYVQLPDAEIVEIVGVQPYPQKNAMVIHTNIAGYLPAAHTKHIKGGD